MQQKQMMILAIVLVVVVIAIVAVVLLMGNKGPATGPGVTPGIPSVTPGVIPAAGGNIICQMSGSGIDATGAQSTMTGTVKVEKPNKIKIEATGTQSGAPMNMVVIINGNSIYMMAPVIFGPSWISTSKTELGASGTDMSSFDTMMGMSASELENEMKSGASSDIVTGGIVPTVSCMQTGDIPDSEFMLPLGVTAKTIAQLQQEMAAAAGGGV